MKKVRKRDVCLVGRLTVGEAKAWFLNHPRKKERELRRREAQGAGWQIKHPGAGQIRERGVMMTATSGDRTYVVCSDRGGEYGQLVAYSDPVDEYYRKRRDRDDD
jgi:hypothetical protein